MGVFAGAWVGLVVCRAVDGVQIRNNMLTAQCMMPSQLEVDPGARVHAAAAALHLQASASASDTCLVPLAASKHLLMLSIAFFTGRFGPETCSMLSRMSLLQHLDLQGSQHADATLLQAVGQISTLQSLHLSRCCQVDDAALQHITGLSNLHTLNISICSKVTDTGLAAVTKLQNLTHLLAQQCRDVTDAGVALLGRLTKLQVGFRAQGYCRSGRRSSNGIRTPGSSEHLYMGLGLMRA
jgi:hypothetical protein